MSRAILSALSKRRVDRRQLIQAKEILQVTGKEVEMKILYIYKVTYLTIQWFFINKTFVSNIYIIILFK